jgi:hypothetical protein
MDYKITFIFMFFLLFGYLSLVNSLSFLTITEKFIAYFIAIIISLYIIYIGVNA